jgi:general secretion pathway protein C
MTSTTINSIRVKPRDLRREEGKTKFMAYTQWDSCVTMIIANMQLTTRKLWMPRLAAFVLALLLAASVVFWVLRWPVRDSGAALPRAATTESLPGANHAVVARMLGAGLTPVAAAVVADAASRFRLMGIIASGRGQGVALLSIDGKPPKPYHVGNQIEDGLVLQSVEQRRAALAPDAKAPVSVQLELPPRQP